MVSNCLDTCYFWLMWLDTTKRKCIYINIYVFLPRCFNVAPFVLCGQWVLPRGGSMRHRSPTWTCDIPAWSVINVISKSHVDARYSYVEYLYMG